MRAPINLSILIGVSKLRMATSHGALSSPPARAHHYRRRRRRRTRASAFRTSVVVCVHRWRLQHLRCACSPCCAMKWLSTNSVCSQPRAVVRARHFAARDGCRCLRAGRRRRALPRSQPAERSSLRIFLATCRCLESHHSIPGLLDTHAVSLVCANVRDSRVNAYSSAIVTPPARRPLPRWPPPGALRVRRRRPAAAGVVRCRCTAAGSVPRLRRVTVHDGVSFDAAHTIASSHIAPFSLRRCSRCALLLCLLTAARCFARVTM